MISLRSSLVATLALAGLATFALPVAAQNDSDAETKPTTYADIVLADNPIGYWRFNGAEVASETSADVLKPAKVQGEVRLQQPGPKPSVFPLFTEDNRAFALNGKGVLKIADPGDNSVLDFDNGDAITLEAWVEVTKLGSGEQKYVIGKGRTGSAGFDGNNQNYALRVAGDDGQVRVSFLFRSSTNRKGGDADWHRWTSLDGFAVGDGWHHIAVTYQFGNAETIRGYIDGKEVKGKWDYGGPTNEHPVVDNDELWIGSASKVNPGNTFVGGIDEVAIYRSALPAERIAARFRKIQPKPYVTNVELPKDGILVEIFEGIPDKTSWDFIPPTPSERYVESRFAWIELPKKYNEQGVQADRSNPHVVWATTEMTFPEGTQRLLLRSRTAARLYIDDQLVAENPFSASRSDGHNDWEPVVSKVSPNIRALQPGDIEKVVDHKFTAGKHRIKLEFFAGGRKRRPELGETSISIAPENSDKFVVLGHAEGFPLTDEGWYAWEDARRKELVALNQQRRREASAEYAKYWEKRHEYAADVVRGKPAPVSSIDEAIDARLAKANIEREPPVDDAGFVRRIYLDTIGIPPTGEQVAAFLADTRPDRRARLIDQLLEHPGWADNWVGYWQDVLAENPNVINPTLNNTGPFRWWIHESLLDNKPFDRFVTELVMMEGSSLYGGPAGFSMATQNDAPMAAKSHILGEAFLGVEMKCARCHDAPFHPFAQEQLFNIAALLNRGPTTLPKTSTIPGGAASVKSSLVKVSLEPGAKIAPRWPFPDLSDGELPKQFVLKSGDHREELALRLTLPQNERFAQVLVNRLWHRYLGRGIVEPVDDWEQGSPSHPELLEYLARELVLSGYDQKHVARLIFNSATYQARPASDAVKAREFAGPTRRRLSAEQVLDSMYSIAGKPFNVEELNIDVHNARPETISLNMGLPTRAWQFTSLSNERDRPSLSLPAAQTMMNVLEAFGWRASRQDPLTVRETDPTVVQPAILANGVAAKRVTQFSEDSYFTELALRDQPVEAFVDAVYLRLLNRKPTASERQTLVELLAPGYESRRTGAAPGPKPVRPPRDGVSWSNHLKPITNEMKVEFQKKVELGDPPTTTLTADWRERAEDAVWALLNSPEFVFIP